MGAVQCPDLEVQISGPERPQETRGRVAGKGCPPPAQSIVDSEEGERREGSRRQLTRETSEKGSLLAHHSTDSTHSSSADMLSSGSENSTSSRSTAQLGEEAAQAAGILSALCFGCSEHSAPWWLQRGS